MCHCESTTDYPSDLSLATVNEARIRLGHHLSATPLQHMTRLSQQHGGDIYFKREDLQPVRSFKVRGALNKLLKLKQNGQLPLLICASAGNHAQGFAYSCRLLNSQGVVFLPKNTPVQKVEQVRYFGGSQVKVVLTGNNYDDCYLEASRYSSESKGEFIHAFDDMDVISGQGTLGVELISSLSAAPDVVLVPVGGGGLAAGVAVAVKALSPRTRVIGVEAEGADTCRQSFTKGERVRLARVDSFADGTAVRQLGRLCFDVCRALLDDVLVVSNADVVRSIYQLNNHYGMVAEPSGALTVAALQGLTCAGQRVVCVISGGNNDAARFAEYQTVLAQEDEKKPA